MKKLLKKYGILIISSFILLIISIDYINYRSPAQSFSSQFNHITSTHAIDHLSYSNNNLEIKFDPRTDPFFVIPFHLETSFPRRLELSFSHISGAKRLSIFFKDNNHPGFSENNKIEQDIEENQLRYSFVLHGGNYDAIRIDFDGNDQESSITISDLTLTRYSIIFDYLYLYPLALLIFVLFTMPGILLYHCLTAQSTHSRFGLINLGFMLSIFFYLIGFILYFTACKSGYNGDTLLLIYVIGTILSLVFLLKITGKMHSFKNTLHKCKWDYITAVLLLIFSMTIITYNIDRPFKNITHHDIAKNKIFSVFNAHDNAFQYYNGMAIAKQESFNKYYGNYRLTYQVQDREILPGVIYAVFRVFLRNFNGFFAASYLTYTMLGTIMNIMVIFPVLLLIDRYFPAIGRLRYLFLLFLSINAFVLPNYYYTWFKFSGAALFLSGLLYLLERPTRWPSWLLAGLLLGLGANMHAANALGIPLIFLWCVFRLSREKGFFSWQFLLYPFSLCLLFIITILPWSVVKALYYPDNYTLIKQSFLDGYASNKSLMVSFKLFMDAHPLNQQLTYRLERVMNTFHPKRFGFLMDSFKNHPITESYWHWSNYEFFFFISSIYSLTVINLLTWLQRISVFCVIRFLGKEMFVSAQIMKNAKELCILVGISILTIFSLIFLTYGYPFPDINHQLPLGIILIIHMGLLGLILQAGRFGYVTMTTYSIWTGYRLFTVCC